MRSANGSNYSRGLTQIELIITLLIISVFFLALVSGFTPIAKGIVTSRSKTLASNLAQEQVEKLKAQSYHRILITANPTVYSDPAVTYDPDYYPQERILAGGIWFDRFTYVQVARENSVTKEIETFDPTTPDTGLKLITITLAWGEAAGNRQQLVIKNLVSNPNMVSTNSVFSGTITNASTSSPIQGAQVTVAENTGWTQTTNAGGSYSLSVLPGNYNIVAEAPGYFTKTTASSIAADQTVTVNFALTAMDSGNVRGYVWQNDHPVISQVVGSSESYAGSLYYQEYIELFNPTNSAITIASVGVPVIDVLYANEDAPDPVALSLTYVRETLPAKGYYLVANTGTVCAGGTCVAADAVIKTTMPGWPDIIQIPDAGAVGIAPAGTENVYDAVGWDRNNGSKSAPYYETEGIDQNIGLELGEQYCRRTSTAAALDIGFGPCYDSGNNNVDFIQRNPISYVPHNSLSATATVIAGVPVMGAAITMDDGLSAGTTSYTVGTVGSPASPPAAEFLMTSVATGTWTAIISGSQYMVQIASVSVSANQTISIPNAATSPTWPVSPYYSAFLTEPATQGYVSGRVTNVSNAVITNPLIAVSDGFTSVSTNSNGYYLLSLVPNTYTITANPDLGNPNYVSQSQSNVVVTLGSITSGVNFILSKGGNVRGYATQDGANPLPDVAFVALDTNEATRAQAISGSDGYFTLINLTTGTYTIEPVLESGETSSPTNDSVTVTEGTTVFSSTFTISGALGYVAGSVSSGGSVIKTGVLVVVTPDTLAGTPPTVPAISSATLTGNVYYTGSSSEEGTFEVGVRGSTTTAYNIYAYYPVLSGTTVTTKYTSVANKYVTAGSSITVNFSSWSSP